MLAITFALRAESADFVRLLERPRVIARAGAEAIYGELHGKTVAVVHTGVGAKASRPIVKAFLHRQRVAYLLSAGFAGALDPELKVGDLLLAENFSSEQLLRSEQLHLEELSIYLAGLTSSEKIISSADERKELAETTGASAVDMETESIAEVCGAHSVPLLSLRAISDTAAEPFPAPPEVLFDLERQKTDPWKLGLYLASHPSAVPRLREFAARIATARAAVANAISILIRSDLA